MPDVPPNPGRGLTTMSPTSFFADMVDHHRGPGFFTAVAGSAVLGSEFLLIGGDARAAAALWTLAVLLWLLLTYAILVSFTVKQTSPASTKASAARGCWPSWRPSRWPCWRHCSQPSSASRTRCG